MRISTVMMEQLSIKDMLSRQASLSKTQLQVASGQRIVTPSDDPSGAVTALDLTESMNASTQYQTNISIARFRLQNEESALTSAGDVLHRARDLTVQSLNDSLTDADRQSISKEVGQLLDQMVEIANTRNANGEFIFAGNRSTTMPFVFDDTLTPPRYVYQGDANQRRIQVGPQTSMADGDSGFDVFENIPSTSGTAAVAAGGGTQSILNTLLSLRDTLTGDFTGAPFHDAATAALNDIDAGQQRILDTRASVGARLNALDNQDDVHGKFIMDTKENLSSIQDLDYAEAISNLNLQQIALQASQQAYVKVKGLSLFNYL
jgi:flagellar hook-associated protein 3 FlgL